MQLNIAVGISLPKDIMKKIDSERGDVSRSRYILRLLEKVCTSNNRKIIKSENSAGSLDNGFEVNECTGGLDKR